MHYGPIWIYVSHCALQLKCVHFYFLSSLFLEEYCVPWSQSRCRDWRDRSRHHATCPGRRSPANSRVQRTTWTRSDVNLFITHHYFLLPLKRARPPPYSSRGQCQVSENSISLCWSPVTQILKFIMQEVAVFQGTFRYPSFPCRSRSELGLLLMQENIV